MTAQKVQYLVLHFLKGFGEAYDTENVPTDRPKITTQATSRPG